MLFRNSPEKFWNLIASKYAASPISDRPAYDKKIQRIKSCLTPDSVVLDIGCGTGTQCGDISGNVRHVTGIDISSKLLAIAEQRKAERHQTNIDFLCTSLFDHRLTPGRFDLVMAFYVLHFMEDIDAVFSHIHKLLKPGGLFVLETACLGDKGKMMGTFLRLSGKLGLLPLINLLTVEQIEQALGRTDFELVDKVMFSKSIGEYTLFARKRI